MRKSSSLLFSQVIAIAGFISIVGPVFYKLGADLNTSSTGLTKETLTSVYSTIFMIWVISGSLFNLNLAWQIDITKLLRYPVTAASACLIKVLFGLTGIWLIAIFLPSVWLLWRASGEMVKALIAIPGLVVFAVIANQCVGLLKFVIPKLSRGIVRSLLLFACCIVCSIFIFAALRAGLMRDRTWLTRLGEGVKSWQGLSIWNLFPGAALADIFRAVINGDYQRYLIYLLVLLLTSVILFVLEAKAHRYYLNTGRAGRMGAPRSSSIIVKAVVDAGLTPPKVLLLAMIKNILETKQLRILLFFFAAYLPVFIVFVPPANLLFVEILIILAAIILSQVKGNLFGQCSSAVKYIYSSPIGPEGILEVRSRAMNYIFAAFVAEILLTALITRSMEISMMTIPSLALFVISLMLIWEMLGKYCSIKFPYGINVSDIFDSRPNSPSSFVMIFGLMLLPAPFQIIFLLAESFEKPYLTPVGYLILTSVIAAFYFFVFSPWIVRRLISRRSDIYRELTAIE